MNFYHNLIDLKIFNFQNVNHFAKNVLKNLNVLNVWE